MEYELAAIVKELARIADALEKLSGVDKDRKLSPLAYRFIAAGEIDGAREVREEIVKREARIKAMEAK